MLDVTVITPTMPGREEFLVDARRSVIEQTEKVAHLIRCGDPGAIGPNPGHLAQARNLLAADVTTEWIACLDDDDMYLPEHFASIAPWLDSAADVIYTWPTEHIITFCDVTGWSPALIASQLRASNLIPSNAAIRRSSLAKMGGWSEDYDVVARRFPSGCTWEDWDLWLRMAEAWMTFVCVPARTWIYRMHPGQSSRTWGE